MLLSAGWLALLLVGCTEKDEPTPTPDTDSVNEWIYEVMADKYLWYDEIPDKKRLDLDAEPEPFFLSLLSDKDGKKLKSGHHYFSRITKKTTETKYIDTEEPAYGFDFVAYYVKDNSDQCFVQITYVLPDSPAAKAGLKRGDWISSIGTSKKDIFYSDLSALFTGGEVVFNRMKYHATENALVENGSIKVGAAEKIENNPLLVDSVYQVGGKKIGYLMYNHFTAGPNGKDDTSYNDQLKELFVNFKKEGVEDFVLDLRYNGGGYTYISCLLASYLAPADALGKVIMYTRYNKKNSNKDYTYRFENAAAVASTNLDLSRLYVLTGSTTASSSELIINNLIPYMGKNNVRVIGEKTVGKTVGSVEYGEDEKYDWLISPIVCRAYNSEEKADYEDGFTPDVKREELTFGNRLYALGDTRELLLRTALQEITGGELRSEEIEHTPEPNSPFRVAYHSAAEKGKGMIFLE